jgi:hypothetical protein
MSVLYPKDTFYVLDIRIAENSHSDISIVITEETRDRLLPYTY